MLRLSFLERAESSAVKTAAYLDWCVSKAELEGGQCEPGMELLSRIVSIWRALSGSYFQVKSNQFAVKFPVKFTQRNVQSSERAAGAARHQVRPSSRSVAGLGRRVQAGGLARSQSC